MSYRKRRAKTGQEEGKEGGAGEELQKQDESSPGELQKEGEGQEESK